MKNTQINNKGYVKGVCILFLFCLLSLINSMPAALLILNIQVYHFTEVGLFAVLSGLILRGFALYALSFFRHVNGSLRIAFWTNALVIFFQAIRLFQFISPAPFISSRIVSDGIIPILVLIANLSVIWGMSYMFKEASPRVSKGFKRLFILMIISIAISFLLLGAIFLVLVNPLLLVYELYLLRYAYIHLRKESRTA